MNPKAKKFLSNFFFGLFSNDHAIEGAKSHPWWVAVIIGLFGVLIPVIPITVAQARTYGASFLSNYTYRFDQNIAEVTVEMANEGKEFKVENKTLTYYINDNKVNVNTEHDDTKPVATHISNTTGQYELMVYYTAKQKGELNTLIDRFNTAKYKVGTIEAPEEGYEGRSYSPSFVILSVNGIYTKLNKDDSNEAGSNTYTAYASDWKHFKEGTALVKEALPAGKTAEQVNLNSEDDVQAIFKNWKEYYNKSYISQKTYNTWMISLLFFGIYAALAFILGLLVFLLTRGKNNMFNYLKFFDTQKIVYWSTLSPAILAMILGFIFTNFAQMMFIILIGLRVMWISMKQLRPQY